MSTTIYHILHVVPASQVVKKLNVYIYICALPLLKTDVQYHPGASDNLFPILIVFEMFHLVATITESHGAPDPIVHGLCIQLLSSDCQHFTQGAHRNQKGLFLLFTYIFFFILY